MKMTKSRNSKTIYLYTAILAYFLSAHMFDPFFSMYVKDLGGSYGEFALILSVTGFVLSVIQSYIGYLSDKIGSGKLVILGGALSSISLILTGVLYHRYFILPFYLLMNIGMGILVPSVFTLISYQKTSKGDSFIPVYRSIQGVGVIIGPIVGGWMIGRSYQGNVLAGGVLMLVSTLLFATCFAGRGEALTSDKAHNQENPRVKFNFREALREILHNRAFLVLMLLFTMIELSYDLIRLNLPIVGAELQFDTEVIGTALSAYFVTFTLFQIPINNALKKLKRRTALVLMGVLSLLPCALLILEIPSFFTIIIMAGVGMTIGSLFTFCSVLAAEESPEDKKGTYMGVFNTIMPCTNVISPIITAGLAGVYIKGPYILAVVLILIFIILSMYFDKKENNDRQVETY